jgi:hypothetical protein
MERRRRRSANRSVALALLLDSCRQRAGLDALVVANRHGGLMSASTRGDVDPETVAAHLPRTWLRDRIPALSARTLKVGGDRLFLGALGAPSERLPDELLHVLRGVRRIYSEARTRA